MHRRQKDCDVSMRKISSDEIKAPLKIITEKSMTEGLRAGHEENGDFFFISKHTEIFKRIFGERLENISTDLNYFYDIFDQQETSSNCADSLKRGFTCCVDIGFGRDGVMQHTTKSQGK